MRIARASDLAPRLEIDPNGLPNLVYALSRGCYLLRTPSAQLDLCRFALVDAMVGGIVRDGGSMVAMLLRIRRPFLLDRFSGREIWLSLVSACQCSTTEPADSLASMLTLLLVRKTKGGHLPHRQHQKSLELQRLPSLARRAFSLGLKCELRSVRRRDQRPMLEIGVFIRQEGTKIAA